MTSGVPTDALYTVNEVAARLHLTPRYVHGLVRSGKLRCVQVTERKRAFTEEQIQQFIESRTIPSPNVSVDKGRKTALPSAAKKGGLNSIGDSTRAQLREEVLSWR